MRFWWLSFEKGDNYLDKHRLRSVIEERSDLLIQNMTPYFNQSDEWNSRYLNAIWQPASKDNPEIFEIRKNLLRLGYANDFMDWTDIIKHNPQWAIDYIEILLELFTDFLKDDNFETSKLSNRKLSVWRGSQIEQIQELSVTLPNDILMRILPLVIDILNDTDEKIAESIWFNQYSYRLNDEKYSLTNGVLKLIFEAGKQLESDSHQLWQHLSPFLEQKNSIVEHILASLMLNLDISYSDEVINWLLTNKNSRLACGIDSIEPKWITPSKLIEKFSPHCSDANFEKLENAIVAIGLSKPLDKVKSCLPPLSE